MIKIKSMLMVLRSKTKPTFKENCPDLRNTKVIDVITELKNYKIQPFVVDPWCSTEEAKKEYNLTLTSKPKKIFMM